MSTAFESKVERGQPKNGGQFRTPSNTNPEAALPAAVEAPPEVGPSTITRGQAIGYYASEPRMSRAFIPVEERDHYAKKWAAEAVAEGNPDSWRAKESYWMRQFDAYDAFEGEAPEGYTEAQRTGYESVTRERMNIDLDHQPLSYNIRTVRHNEELALTDGPYRRSSVPERQAELTAMWDARAARLREVAEKLEAVEAREQLAREEARAAALNDTQGS